MCNPPSNKWTWIVFTDLDGTLLDGDSYSFAAAHEALSFLADKSIDVIPCTSKTYREVAGIRQQIGLKSPFIVENGSALFIPDGYFHTLPLELEQIDDYSVLQLGKTYSEILQALEHIKSEFSLKAKGFKEMDLAEISAKTGLPMAEAEVAKDRHFSEPFVLEKGSGLSDEVYAYAMEHGLRILKGNRFYHLIGDTDKGQAVIAAVQIYKLQNEQEVRSIGIGDSMNDLEMLKSVHIPVQVRKKDGSFAPGMDMKDLLCTKGIGPEGWQEAVFQILGPMFKTKETTNV